MKTIDDLIDALNNIDLEKLNPVVDDGSSIYTDDDGNHCLIGEIFSYWGLRLPDVNHSHNNVPIAELYHMPDYNYRNEISSDILYPLIDMQENADLGIRWKYIVKRNNDINNYLMTGCW